MSLPPPPPALTDHLTRLSDSLRRSLTRRRPWLELLDRSAFSRPESLSHALTRVRKNLSYFRVNYLAVVAAVLALSLFSHPFSLFTLVALVAAWIYVLVLRPADRPIVVFGRAFSDREAMWILIAMTVFAVFLTSVGSVLMSACVIGVGIVCVHGAFRDPEDLFLDDSQDLVGSGLFSNFLGGSVTQSVVVAAAAPAVVTRV